MVLKKKRKKLAPIIVLISTYLLFALNLIFGTKIYSMEWAFLLFVVSTAVFYRLRLDFRFLIVPGILLLAYLPFFLISGKNAMAESVAVYAFYFLAAGVALQLTNYCMPRKLNFSLADIIMFWR